MSPSIFKDTPPLHQILSFLESICLHKTNEYLYITPYSFKKASFHNTLDEFISMIATYYYTSKLHFVNKTHTYKSFLTIIRHFCKHHLLNFTYSVKYFNSRHEIHYKIFFPSNHT